MKQANALRRRINFIPPELRPSPLGPAALAHLAVIICLALPCAAGLARAWRWQAEQKLERVTLAKEAVTARVTSSVQSRDSSADVQTASTIKKALSERLYWAEVFKELSNVAPKSVWLTSFDTSADADGKKVLIAGHGNSQGEVAEFFSRLERSYFFRDVQIKYSESTETAGTVLYRFQFEGKVFDNEKGGGGGPT